MACKMKQKKREIPCMPLPKTGIKDTNSKNEKVEHHERMPHLRNHMLRNVCTPRVTHEFQGDYMSLQKLGLLYCVGPTLSKSGGTLS